MVIPLLIIQGGKGLNPQSLKPYVFPVSLNRRKTVLCAINGKRPNVQGCQKPDVTEVYWVWLFCTKPHFHTFLIINLFNDCCSRSKTEEIESGVFVIGTQEKISSTLRTVSQAEWNALQKRSFQLGKDMVSKQCQISGTVYHSKSYKRVTARNNFTVRFSGRKESQYGSALNYVKVQSATRHFVAMWIVTATWNVASLL